VTALPPRRHHPRATGVALLDRCVGGAAPGLGLVVAGDTGTGRTVLCLQIAAAALERGERAVFLTSEPAEILLRQAESLGLELLSGLSIGRLLLLELLPDSATVMRAHGAGPLLEALGEEAPDADWLIIDPLTALTSDLLDERPLRDTVARLLSGYREGQHIVAAADTEMLRRHPALERALSDACGSLIHLRRDEDGLRQATVLKSRFASGSSGRVRFGIDASGTRPLDDEPPAIAAAERPAEGPAAPASAGEVGPRSAEPGEIEAPPAPSSEPAPLCGKRAKILVVNADAVRRDALVKNLSEAYDVVAAETAFGALSRLLTEQPDLVVLDLKLPDMSGYEVLSALQRTPQPPAVLALSENMARAADRIRALVLGAADVLPASCARYEVLRKVEDLLHAPRRTRAGGGAAPGPQDLLALASSHRRQVEAAEFLERVERAHHFGESFGIPSCCIAVEAGHADDLEVVVIAAEKLLRAEDALLVIGERRALLLLVAAGVPRAPTVVERIKRRTERMVDLLWGCRPLGADAVRVSDWTKYFESFELEVW
jgi:CheY-like chemotaxis protein/KaiC/GvpD/RAD55 family RecA-like ATPase